MKKVLMLGGSRYVIPVIKAAHELGYYVITCDYLPDNIGHQYADEYHYVSIIDKEAVLELARNLRVNGVMSFATDPGVVVAAYVAEQLGLPTSPYNSVSILQDKFLFRSFLRDNGFNVPFFKEYTDVDEACVDSELFTGPVIVKPVDSAGSKGVTKVEDRVDLRESIMNALKYSHSGRFIIEQFIKQSGYSSDSDCFSVEGELVFTSFNSQRFDADASNPYTPAAYSWPSSMPMEHQGELTCELQRLTKLLNMGTTIYNIETRVGEDGKVYIMEVSPRGGGNRLAEMIRFSTGIDLIKNAVRAAVGEPISGIAPAVYKGCCAEYILHSNKEGVFEIVEIEPEFRKKFVVECDVWVKKGEKVKAFTGANETIGTLVLKFDTQEQTEEMLSNPDSWLKVIVH
ncbi:ATP-grasp domain-containing protein [Desulfosporosinus youngiae]|uniref:Biotin carboxylase n=1 Tax=Desulfosporosinus youngiae DSM 17734 TaxID=768710 RepID=H5XZG0_9FIRM|nr:ATP-grasp domain-containing protein [Desulfosporosinus youngiae]EHQ91866.1 biotin carboxylase [Desulfosporosinus youngiae DSM 17734]